ncbi:hypothetical protein ACXM2N_07635 [Corynebacterium sp. ZY180755]
MALPPNRLPRSVRRLRRDADGVGKPQLAECDKDAEIIGPIAGVNL